MAVRRAYADEYAERVNRAAALLDTCSPAAARRGLQAEHGLSERQARRYVRAAQDAPDGVVVPERTVVFTVRLPGSLIARLRALTGVPGVSLSATVAELLERGLGNEQHERAGSERDGAAR
jgi:hypothetical protein